MQFTVIQVWYYIGVEPVTVVMANPLGGLTQIETTQTELDAARADQTTPWSDDEVLIVATEKLHAKFPAMGALTLSLYEPPAPPEGEGEGDAEGGAS